MTEDEIRKLIEAGASLPPEEQAAAQAVFDKAIAFAHRLYNIATRAIGAREVCTNEDAGSAELTLAFALAAAMSAAANWGYRLHCNGYADITPADEDRFVNNLTKAFELELRQNIAVQREMLMEHVHDGPTGAPEAQPSSGQAAAQHARMDHVDIVRWKVDGERRESISTIAEITGGDAPGWYWIVGSGTDDTDVASEDMHGPFATQADAAMDRLDAGYSVVGSYAEGGRRSYFS